MKNFFAISCCILLLFFVVSCGDSKEKLVTAPSEEYVIECLEKVPGIIDIEAVTEDTDPMKNLNKPGWYTAHIYFSYELVNQNDVYGDDLIDKGTDAGGSIEVYKTKSEANERNEYLSSFDGGVLDSDSHTVIGTLVVRTSDELTASQQKLLETNIISALTNELDKIVNPFENSNSDNSNNNQEFPSAVGTYSKSGYTLIIYDDGTLYLSYNGEYMHIEGTWTQSENTICYSVWNIDGFEWNNPFYDTVYDDGIDFLGDYYKRVETNNSSSSNNCLGTYYMEDYANSHIDIFSDNTLVIYDADNRLNLEGYTDTISYTYVPANDPDYENTYAMLKIDLSDLYPNELSHFEFIHIFDDFTIMYNGYKFSN